MDSSHSFEVEVNQHRAHVTLAKRNVICDNETLSSEQCDRTREAIAETMETIIDDLQASYRQFISDPLFAISNCRCQDIAKGK